MEITKTSTKTICHVIFAILSKQNDNMLHGFLLNAFLLSQDIRDICYKQSSLHLQVSLPI